MENLRHGACLLLLAILSPRSQAEISFVLSSLLLESYLQHSVQIHKWIE